MHVTALRHVPFEDLGAFAPALSVRLRRYAYFDVGADDLATFDPLAPDLLIVLGGPIGVYEEDRYPFIAEELRVIRRRLSAGRPIMGICFGAQLIAAAMDARVYPSGGKEIGFAPITLTPAGRASCLAPFADDPIALHWHGDTFDLPEGATLLASTPACVNQAFSAGPNVIAFQFHPEGGGAFERWLIGHANEISGAGININRLRADHAIHGERIAQKADAVLGAWLEQIKP